MKLPSNLSKLFMGASAAALISGLSLPAEALTVRDDVGVEGSEDEDRGANEQWDGVVQLYFWSNAGGVFFNCTGSLVNHRTVLSAAHCFNDQPSNTYGLDRAGGNDTIIAAYGPDTIPTLLNWLNTGQTTIDRRNGLTFSQQVITHPDADFGQVDFPGADVALIALADPLADLPTYSMLFSPVSVGEHVSLAAYGGHGTGSTGNVGIDGKRQAGENILGMLGSQNDFLRGLDNSTATFFGAPDGDQIMYWIDFDNPERDGDECRRRTAEEGFFGAAGLQCDDWSNGVFLNETLFLGGPSNNFFDDDALDNEAGTAGGDSGSALFFDELNDELLIGGVLSGGFNFVTNPGNGYGDVSYYTSLFQYFQFIEEANPLKYVSSVAGDGNWSDASHWVQDLDPSYRIIDANGNVVNGIPDGPEPGLSATGPKEGEIYGVDINDVDPAQIDQAAAADASAASTGLASGLETSNFRAGGLVDVSATDFVANGLIATMVTADSDDAVELNSDLEEERDVPTFGVGDVDFGLLEGAGSTNFTPNNGFNAAGFINYFDVTLGEAGTTTADIDVEIDTLTLANADATLAINDDVLFLALVDTQIGQGTLDVGGIFASRDILNFGLITGRDGTIVTDTLFNAGTLTAGTGLTVDGDLVLTSASTLLYQGNAVDVLGDVSIDGGITGVKFGDSGTLLTFTGARTGFFSPDAPGVLEVTYTYGAGDVAFEVIANDFETEFGGAGSANTLAVGGLLDQLRADNYASNSGFYDTLDVLSGQDLTNALDSLAPTGILGVQQSNLARTETRLSQIGARIKTIRAGRADGASVNVANTGAGSGLPMMGLAMQADAAAQSSSTETASGWGSFVEVTAYQGDQEALSASDERDIDGLTLTAGIDRQISEDIRLGGFLSYGESDNDAKDGASVASTEGFTLGAYGVKTGGYLDLSGYVGYGQTEISTARTGLAGGTISGDTDATEIMIGVAGSKAFNDHFEGIASLDYVSYDIDGYTETGGVSAVTIGDETVESLQGSLGGNVYFTKDTATWQPRVGGRLVYDFSGEESSAVISLPGQVGTAGADLVGSSDDLGWIVVSAGLDYQTKGKVVGGVFVEQTLDRDNLDYTTFGARLRLEF
ncbi:MAG: autotransporter domain-containing protein [Pseudomonadota bacterium]